MALWPLGLHLAWRKCHILISEKKQSHGGITFRSASGVEEMPPTNSRKNRTMAVKPLGIYLVWRKCHLLIPENRVKVV